MKHYTKDPDDTVDYSVDWSQWLESDTIQSSTWTLPAGITLGPIGSSNTTTKATVWLTGGTADNDYVVTNRIVTVGGRTKDRSILIEVRSQ